MKMGVTFCKIDWRDSATNTVKELTPIINWNSKRAVNVKSNSAEIMLKNIAPESIYSDYFDSTGNLRLSVGGTTTTGGTEAPDDIKIYLGTAPVSSTVASDMLCSMSIVGIEQAYEEEGKSIKLNCADKTFLLLSQYAVGNYPITGSTAPVYQLIQQVIRQWTRTGNSTADVIDVTSYMATTRSDLSAFPGTFYTCVYKPIYEVVQELSQPQYTGDTRPFLFWVDELNNLHWLYPSQTGGITLSDLTGNVYSINIKKEEREEVNMIIFNAGKDKNGISILDYAVNLESPAAKLKIAYYDWSEITSNMKNPVVIAAQWTNLTNDQVRGNAKQIGQGKCKAKFAGKGLVWKGTIMLKGTKSYIAGDLILFTSKSMGFSSYKLRVMDVVHTMDIEQGWTTSLVIEEDPLAMPV